VSILTLPTLALRSQLARAEHNAKVIKRVSTLAFMHYIPAGQADIIVVVAYVMCIPCLNIVQHLLLHVTLIVKLLGQQSNAKPHAHDRSCFSRQFIGCFADQAGVDPKVLINLCLSL